LDQDQTTTGTGPPAAYEDIAIGWVDPGKVSTPFVKSLLATLAYDRVNGCRIGGWIPIGSSANISAGRNEVVEQFLASPASWLAMVDTDMVWPPDAIHRLVESADPEKLPVVGGLCFAKEQDTGMVWPTLFVLVGSEDDPQLARYDEWIDGEMLPVAATGAAFLVMHRSVLEAVRDHGFSKAYPWFQEREFNGQRSGEDATFCLRVAAVGGTVHVNTAVDVGHIKEHIVTVEGYRAQRAMLAQREYLAAAYPEEFENHG
jgi:hypothetical protein